MLLNVAATKKFIKQYAKDKRQGWQMNRVSDEAIENLNAKLRIIIMEAIQRHPTVGKTFTYTGN